LKGVGKLFARESSEGPPTAQKLLGQNPKKKNVLSILEKISRAQIRKARNFFLFGVAE